ncbi:MAG TPA: hypothetical protein VFE06_16195 [Acidobacteriaceae bacterium]|jgi:hypothetical protein|nr:hypothetical protein [Acidobacteriaceae bacterium]
MSQSRSAGAAVWVLDHLVPGGSDQGLTGDVLEELAEGRSKRWLWRQVALSIAAGISGVVRRTWPALMFALLWSVSAPGLELIQRQNEAFEARLWEMNWPWSTICDLGYSLGLALVFLWSGLVFCVALYSMATWRFDGRRLWRGIWLCVPLYAAALAMATLAVSVTPHSWINIEQMNWMQLIRQPVFIPYDAACWFTLSVALVAALPRGRRKRIRITTF